MPGLLRSGHGDPELPNVANGTNDPEYGLPLEVHCSIRVIRRVRVIRQFQLLWLAPVHKKRSEESTPRSSFLVSRRSFYGASVVATSTDVGTAWSSDATSNARCPSNSVRSRFGIGSPPF